ncbi:germinal-center associated nuclear protein-like [Homarus americanus]|nr:germinal-center associated nuclear protein-like [Homarus americanus]XP_042236027.1 germinal-center associated nuclear protein-like [Homarus americanus]
MDNNNTESSLPTKSFQPPSEPSGLVFASTTMNEDTPDQSQSSVSEGIAKPSTSTSRSNIFPSTSFPVQGPWGNSSSPFGGPDTSVPFSTGSEVCNSFSRVDNNDSSNKGTNIFGGTIASSSTVPKLFGGEELITEKVKESELKKSFISEVSIQSSDDTASLTITTSATPTPSLFGGTVTSTPAVTNTDSWPSSASSSSIFGVVEARQVPKVFGGSSTFPLSGSIALSKRPFSGNKTTTSGESLISGNIIDEQAKESKVFPLTSSSSLPFSGHQALPPASKTPSVFGGSSLVAKPFSKTPTNLEKKALLSKTETNKISSQMADEKPHQGAPESKSVPTLIPKVIPELFEKDEAHASSSSLPTYHKKELTKIIIAQIPDRCMDKEILKNHFGKFGDVKRIMLNPKVNQATVQYSNHHAASKAKKKGKKIHPKLPEVKIFYGTPVRRKSEEGNSDAMMSKKKAIKTLQHGQQSSDLDPYIPLERPCSEKAKQLKHSSTKTLFQKDTHLNVNRRSVTSNKIPSRAISPARENKDPTLSIEGKDMKAILDSQAVNNFEKHVILKTRDKLLRNERTRTSDLKMASYLAATCPDMCPELERYMRDVQNDLSSYEMTNGVLDHRLVTKKFSRSSADKDVPLPHELRPGPVLLRTMNFLVCNIINQGDAEDTEVDVWYNYLWNRTRAVRNDLMQQQLTNSVAVVIMERCTRFHIHAAAQLCQEPSDLFDAKMNTEHLIKSLQTLKELYHDLGERGEYFESEAEFRAYEMLLNLNDGETIVTRYSQFREEVQKSLHVQFALKVVLSVTFNNYVKFFKLIRRATYLQGCLLHRYFRQVRSKALDIFMKAYVPSKAPQTVPLQTVIKILGFENETDAVNYLKCHGISVEDQNVVFDKYAFIQNPEEIPQLVRPITLIDVNRTCSVGEVIQGGPIPDNPLHTHVPHNSFDDQGYLKPEAKDASDQKGENAPKPPEMLDSVLMIQQSERLQNYELLAQVKYVYNMIESSIIEEVTKQVCSECIEVFKYELSVKEAAHTVNLELLEESIQEEVRTLSCEGLCEVKCEKQEMLRRQKEEEERKCKALKELYDAVGSSINASYLNEFTDGYMRQICQESIQEVETHATLTDLMEELPSQFVNEIIMEQLRQISIEVIEEMNAEQESKVLELQQKILLRKTRGYFRKWRVRVLKARRQKQSQEMFPADCSHLSITQQNDAFGWGYQRSRTSDKSALQLARLESSISRNMEKVLIRNQLIKEYAWHPLLLKHLVMKEVDKSLPPHNLLSQYFKFIVCTSESSGSTILHWLRAKLGSEKNVDLRVPLNNCFSFVSKKSGVEYGWVMKEVLVATTSAEDIMGTSAILFVTSCRDKKESQYWKIQDLLTKKVRASQHVLHYNCEACDANAWNLTEADLLKPETSLKLQFLMMGFWKQQETLGKLVSSHMNNFVCGFIAEKFVEPALRKHNERKADGKSPIPPSVLIDLYNSVIDYLIKTVKNEDLKNLEWPPPELNHLGQIPPVTWNNTDAKHVADILGHIKLPTLWMEGIMSWKNITEVLYTYVTKVSGPHDDGIRLVSHLNAILSNTQKILGPILGYESDTCQGWELHVLQLPWTELVYACVSYKLSELPDIPVFYQPKKLQSFTSPHSWWSACDTSDPLWTEDAKENYSPCTRKRKAEKQGEFPSEQIKKKKDPSKFLGDIENEKQKCKEFEKKLERLLVSEEELNLLFNVES